MTPRAFAGLTLFAVVSAIAAIVVYTSSIEWSPAARSGTPLFADLHAKAPKVAAIEIEQGQNKISLKRQGKEWLLSDHEFFPASQDKVKALLAGLSQAKLMEPKTRKKDRFALLGLEDPKSKDAKSSHVRLRNERGAEVAAVIVGNKRFDAFGVGRNGTYVRRPADDQAWLANGDITASSALTDWVNPQIFEASTENVKSIEVTMPDEEPLKIMRDPNRDGHTLAGIPSDMKLKYVNIVDNVVRAASTVNFTDVRKARAPSGDTKASVVTMELEGGLKATYRLWREGDSAWISLEASGEGEGKKLADAIMARAKGWEFRIPQSRAEEILKRREDLLEKVSS